MSRYTVIIVCAVVVIYIIMRQWPTCKPPAVEFGEFPFMDHKFTGLWVKIPCVKGKMVIEHTIGDEVDHKGEVDYDDIQIRDFIANHLTPIKGYYYFPLQGLDEKVSGKEYTVKITWQGRTYTYKGTMG